MQSRVDRQVLGRVMSVLMFSPVGLLPISLLAGIVAQAHLLAMFVASGFLILAVGTVAALTSGLRLIE